MSVMPLEGALCGPVSRATRATHSLVPDDGTGESSTPFAAERAAEGPFRVQIFGRQSDHVAHILHHEGSVPFLAFLAPPPFLPFVAFVAFLAFVAFIAILALEGTMRAVPSLPSLHS